MNAERPPVPVAVLDACDQEPIHLAGSIQPGGFLLAVDEADGRVVQASENAGDCLGRALSAVLGATPGELFGAETEARVRELSRDARFARGATFVGRWARGGSGDERVFALLGHRHAGRLILEGERLCAGEAAAPVEAHEQIEVLLGQMETPRTVDELLAFAARELRGLTGFDRVLVYRFDADWHGRVVAEDRNDALPSYLDLHFPASDIPRQARELYRLNRLRLIADASYEPVPIRAAPGRAEAPLDLSLATLRSVSPVHREYMRNMGTGASFSISLMRDGELWGLVSCHNAAPRRVPFAVRAACALFTQALSLQLAVREQAEGLAQRMRLQAILTPVVAGLARHERLLEGIDAVREHLLRLVGADGAAVIEDDRVASYGCAPDERRVRELARWLDSRGEEELLATHQLAAEFPEAAGYAAEVSGLLALSISPRRRSRVIWFRREVVETVTWGGDPAKPLAADAAGPARLHPRKSFERWRELLRGRARPWSAAEIETAREFRVAVVDIVLRGAERLAQLSEELSRTNRELENFSYTVSHDLRAPFRHIRGYAELLKSDKGHLLDAEGLQFLEYVLEGSRHAGRLVDNILAFSRMGRAALVFTTVALDELVPEAIRFLKADPGTRRIEWVVGPLPKVEGDQSMLLRVVHNLLENAVKFTGPRELARIEVWAEETPTEHVVHVRDNGVGFDPRYKDKLFGMFQRLHDWEEFSGAGIGLASVRRVVARHGGRVWADGRPDGGATFSFSLPKTPSPSHPLYA